MSLQIYNTLTRKKEPFEPLETGLVRMYVCGPTVYDRAHVGHAMSSMVFDIIRRYLIYKGFEVEHVMNYTDVDDKVIVRAAELGVEPFELSNRYIKEYAQHLKELYILPAKAYPRVSEEIQEIIEMVAGLIDRGRAYVLQGDVYFRVSSDEDYGKLSGRRLEEMRAGARLEIDVRKEDPADFALWKAAKEGEPAWDSPWGAGRPGWHIECSAMSRRYLGDQIDIHGGGNDLIFPHHENEIAQTESLTGKPFARYWVHNGMMQLSGADMSKSTGNVFTIEAFLHAHPADVLRLMVLNANYRSPLTYSDEVLHQAHRALERLRSGLRPAQPQPGEHAELAAELQIKADQTRKGFEASMDDDFNTAGALGQLFELVRAVNQGRDAGLENEQLNPAQSTLLELSEVFGLQLEQDQSRAVAPFIDLLIELREELRQRKQFELADRVRDRLMEQGVILEDGKASTSWRFE